MTRTFADAIEPQHIPIDQVDGALLYVDGHWPAPAEQVKRFKAAGKTVAHVTVFGDWRDASIIDVENGDATPADARLFVINRNRYRPGTATVYCNLAKLPLVRQHCMGLTYHLWAASWTTTRPHTTVDGAVAVQYVDHGPWDETAVFDDHWHPHKG